MSGQWTQCPDCVNCDECGAIAYCLADAVSFPPCAHDKALCGDCNLGACPDCRLEAERELYASGEYSQAADPFYRPENEASDAAYWSRSPLNMPGSPGFRPKGKSDG